MKYFLFFQNNWAAKIQKYLKIMTIIDSYLIHQLVDYGIMGEFDIAFYFQFFEYSYPIGENSTDT